MVMSLLSDFTREISRACNKEERADDADLSWLSCSGHFVPLLTVITEGLYKTAIIGNTFRHMV